MIIFLEGNPGSGKSYSCVVDHVFPALKAGRHVFIRLDGFDDDNCLRSIASVLDMPFDIVADLITYIKKDKSEVISYFNFSNDLLIPGISDNSLLVIDEIKDFFESTRGSLSSQIVNFFGEHRKHQIDIICIDQKFSDAHQLIRRRTEFINRFVNLDYLGMGLFYRWTKLKTVPLENRESNLVQVSSGISRYNKRYFSCYKSFLVDAGSDGVVEYNRYSAANFFKSSRFLIVFLPIPFLLFFAYYFVKSFFSDGVVSDNKETQHVINSPALHNNQLIDSENYKGYVEQQQIAERLQLQKIELERDKLLDQQKKDKEEKEKSEKKAQLDLFESEKKKEYIHALLENSRPRFASFMQSGNKRLIAIDFCDNTGHVLDRLTESQIILMGWTLEYIDFNLIKLKSVKYGDEYYATPWPRSDLRGVISSSYKNSIKDAAEIRHD